MSQANQNNSAARQCMPHPRDANCSMRCPLTRRPCEGDLAYLCEDYGCARKAGLSPHSAENL
jgi:hypothetical protein